MPLMPILFCRVQLYEFCKKLASTIGLGFVGILVLTLAIGVATSMSVLVCAGCGGDERPSVSLCMYGLLGFVFLLLGNLQFSTQSPLVREYVMEG